ncbi:hypothetical protein Q1695_009889 [Nippostrongylus brasiliensis]|nr:hypothetical protein Q1695_009889 [Nippostrongylus brasiliensis]
MLAPQRFWNPENHVPYVEEMKHTYAREHESVLNKVANLPPGELIRYMIGQDACRCIFNTPLYNEMLGLLRLIRENLRKLDTSITARRCFPKYIPAEGLSAENAALGESALVSFMNGVMNFVIPKELLSAQQRSTLVLFITSRILTWREGTPLLCSNETYPPVHYAVIEKQIKMNLPKYWAIFNNDKYFTDVLFEDISVNLTHFFVLFALHSLRTQTKVGFVDGVALFFFTETYTKLKSSLAANAAKNGSSKVRLISGDDSLLSDDSAIDRIAPSCSTPTSQRSGAVNTESHSNSHVEATNGASIDRSTTTNDDESGRSAVKRKSTTEDGNSDSTKARLYFDATFLPLLVFGKHWAKISYKLKFPRDRPPDDIPVYDYTKVKREKFDPNFSAMETGSQISNESSSNRLSRSSVVDEWEEVLKTVTTDPSVSDEYKMAFRCLVMSNRDLREHNKVLRSQLERAVGKQSQ